MDHSDYDSVRCLLRVPDSAIHSLYRCGSRVYGTSNARSDEDFVAEHRLKETRPAFTFVLDRQRLAAAALSRSKSDFDKAAKRFTDEPLPSKKKLFHALRVASFALQIARHERIVNFGETNALWRQIEAQQDAEWEPYQRTFGPVYDRLARALRLLEARG